MKIPNWSVPLTILVLIVSSVYAAHLFAIPSLTIEVVAPDQIGDMQTEVADFIVEGVKCVDTARTASQALVTKKGIIRFVAYASHNRLEITFDPNLWTPETIAEALEGPIYDRETKQILFNQYTVLQINEHKVLNAVSEGN